MAAYRAVDPQDRVRFPAEAFNRHNSGHVVRKESTSLSGTVVSGLGEGRHYMSMVHYRKQFAEKLGFIPYAGTLNIKLSARSSKMFSRIKRRRGISINGPAKGGKAVEMARCYPANLSRMECVIVVPKLSKHKGVAEIISAKRLRSALKLRDGSKITVVVDA